MLNEKPQIIERLSPPTEFDTAGHLALCLVSQDNSAWVQIAKDDETPKWLRFESMSEALYYIHLYETELLSKS